MTDLIKSAQLPAQQAPLQSTVLSEDMKVGHISLVQSLNHPLVKSNEAKHGDIFYAGPTMRKVVSGVGRPPVEILPICSSPVWHWCFLDGKKEVISWEPRTNSNPEYRQKDYTRDLVDREGKTRKAHPRPGVKAVVLLVSDLDAMPAMLDIKKTSHFSAGTALETVRALTERAGKPLFGKVFLLGAQEQNYQGNDFLVYTLTTSRVSTDEEISACTLWEGTFKVRPVDLDESQED